MFFEVMPTEIYRAGGDVLTYSSDLPLSPGHVVLVPLGKKSVIGIVMRRVPRVSFPTKPIQRLIHPIPLPSHLLKSLTWLANYYLAPAPAVANLLLPAGLLAKTATKDFGSGFLGVIDNPSGSGSGNLSFSGTSAGYDRRRDARHPRRRNGATSFPEMTNYATQSASIILNNAQRSALEALQHAPGTTKLLRGVTGSGKTNIYLKMASTTLLEGKSVILLVPEIALTSQLVKIFEQTFGNLVTLIHSNQTLVERRKTWLDLLEATSSSQAERGPMMTREMCYSVKASQPTFSAASREEQAATTERAPREDGRANGLPKSTTDCALTLKTIPRVIIGPRSALLAPLHNLGLILIDESHESAYYQENTPRYSALRLASFIANTLKIPCIQGTATPNIVDFHLAKSHNSLVELTEKAKSTALDPETTLVDLKDRANFQKNRYFSNQLLTAIEKNIQAKHQTLIFHNRRGSSPLTICEECGWQALCPACYLPMTLHTDGFLLACHICGHEEKVPTSCPGCGHPGIIHKGFGTKLLESELTRLFPQAKIARFDGDNKKSDTLAHLYEEVKSGKIDLLIGTQTLARGLDLPHLATVGVVQADAGLALPDFAAEERAFELLTQVIGRVGRGHLDRAEVIIQTYQPDHPVLKTALAADFQAFAAYLLEKRHQQALPPYTYLARLSATYKTEKTALKKIQTAFAELSQNPKLTLSPPTPAFHERTTSGYTWQIILKSPSRLALQKSLAPYAAQNFRLELDPPSLL